MNTNRLKIDFERHTKDMKKMFKRLPHVVGSIAVEHSMKSFANESFKGSRKSWPKRKGNKDPGRKLLIGKGSGDLRRSINYEVRGSTAYIGTDVVYAQVHNEGGRAGRGKGFQMQERKFMGNSPEIDKEIGKHLDKVFNEIFK